jgi:hypothetical protein
MQGRHIDTGSQKKRIFFVPRFFMLNTLGGGGYDVRKQALVLFVSSGKKTADRVDLFVVMLEIGTNDFSRAALLLGIIHVGMDFVA